MTPVTLKELTFFQHRFFPEKHYKEGPVWLSGPRVPRQWDSSASVCPAGPGRPRPRPRTVGGEQEIGCVLLREPSYLVDLLLYLQTLQVIELWLVALEGAVDIVLSPAMGLVFALQEGEQRGV